MQCVYQNFETWNMISMMLNFDIIKVNSDALFLDYQKFLILVKNICIKKLFCCFSVYFRPIRLHQPNALEHISTWKSGADSSKRLVIEKDKLLNFSRESKFAFHLSVWSSVNLNSIWEKWTGVEIIKLEWTRVLKTI